MSPMLYVHKYGGNKISCDYANYTYVKRFGVIVCARVGYLMLIDVEYYVKCTRSGRKQCAECSI